MPAVLGRRLLFRAVAVSRAYQALAGRQIQLNKFPVTPVIAADALKQGPTNGHSSIAGSCSAKLQTVRCLCSEADNGSKQKKVADHVEKAVRGVADKGKIGEEALEKIIALIREGVAQGYSKNPEENASVQEKMDALGPEMLYVGGSLLMMAAKKVGPGAINLALPFFRTAALQGHLGSMYSFARFHLDGLAMPKNAAEAARLFQDVIDASKDHADPYPQAVFTLATQYFYGNGVDTDTTRAVELFERSLEAGLAHACLALGMLYEQGNGVVADPAKAVYFYRRGVEKEEPRCMVQLASCYLNGTGVEKDAAKSVELYQQGAELGNSNAMHSLGVCHAEGRGVALDEEKAAYWYSQAAERSHARSCVNLAVFYLEEKGGLKRDIELVKRLLQVAVQNDLPEAAQLIEEVDRRVKEDPSLATSSSSPKGPCS